MLYITEETAYTSPKIIGMIVFITTSALPNGRIQVGSAAVAIPVTVPVCMTQRRDLPRFGMSADAGTALLSFIRTGRRLCNSPVKGMLCYLGYPGFAT